MDMLVVANVMRNPAITIEPYTRLPVIKRLMREHNVHRLPVVDNNRVVGIITLGDVRNAFPSDVPAFQQPTLSLNTVVARDIMRTDVITTVPNAPVAEAATLMLQHKISGLPVVDGARCVGIITKSDLCRMIAAGVALAPSQAVAP